MSTIIGVPEKTEAAPYYFTYIDLVSSGDVMSVLEQQVNEVTPVLRGISEEKSLYRYAPGKWTIRQSWSHVNDAERVFVSRALWFARGFDSPLPSFDQDIGVAGAQADSIAWARHVDEFRDIRQATLSLFRNLPDEAWKKRGTASGNQFTVRAMAYIVAGHTAHHLAILKERYL
ncbi:MAG TPA: DinB family protein [Candidatus Angelobacter sp.]|nr:DinB family protein [Candidatus Angelobacter sp.]